MDIVGAEMVSFDKQETSDIYFCAELSNGQTVFQDVRPNDEHAWARLAKFIKNNSGLKIVGLTVIKPNGKKHECPRDQKGYCFGYKKIKTFMGPSREIDLVMVGYCDGETCYMKWLNQNAKIACEEKRTKKSAGFFLIENPE
jgi:hypothetical protein